MRGRRGRWGCGALSALVAGCSSGAPSPDASLDGGGDAGPDAAPIAITSPAEAIAPAPPALQPCAEGWREVGARCEPWPESGRQSCAPETWAHFPGEPGCVRLGPECPADGWPADLPASSDVLYVAPGGAPTGPGSIDQPFGTIGAAVEAAEPGTIIAVGSGTYDEEVRLPRAITLRGACADETVLTSSTPSNDDAVVTIVGADVELVNFRIGGQRPGISLRGAAASAHLQGVAVVGASDFGILVEDGAQLTAEALLVRDTQERAIGGEYGVGLAVFSGAQATVRRAVVDQNREIAVWILDPGTRVELDGVSLQRTRASRINGRWGQGVDLAGGAELTMASCVVEDNHNGGALVGDPETRYVLRDSVVRNTGRETSSGQFGRGLSVVSGAQAEVDRTTFATNNEAAVLASDAGSTVTLRDVVVEQTAGADGDVLDGFGLALEDGAHGDVERAELIANQTAGVVVRFGATLRATDLVVAETRPRLLDGAEGKGLYVEGDVEIERVLLRDNHEVGVFVGAGHASLTDLEVRATQPGAGTGEHGEGLFAIEQAVVTVSRAIFDGNHGAGVTAMEAGTSVELSDVVVRETQGTGSGGEDGYFGRGLSVQDEASVTGERVALDRNREVGAYASGPATTLLLIDTTIDRTLPRACVEDWCAGFGAGVGLGAYGGAHAEVRRFRIAENAICGVQLAENGAIDLHEGEVADNPIGANVQSGAFDSARLYDDVVFLRNERNLDARGIELPEPQPSF